MGYIIKNLINKIGYGVKWKDLCIYDIITIIFVLLGLGCTIAFFIFKDSKFNISLLISSIIAIAVAQISTGCLNASNHERLKVQDNIHQRLKKIKNELQNHKMLDIREHKDIVIFTKEVQMYYDSKFTTLNIVKKTVDDITKILLIPVTLALISYILKDDIIYVDIKSKLLFIFIFLFFILWVIVMYNMFFELIRSVIKIHNVKIGVFAADLELLSKFEIKEIDDEIEISS